jgi:DNA adenine methylase
LRPLLKWAGGKRNLLKNIVSLLPDDYNERRYHEPFLGGGAVFFHIEPRRGSINDINSRLMNFYKVVRDRPLDLIKEASKYRYEEKEYYTLRDRFNSTGLSELEDAALLLYLNKTAYNGLYRVNSKGEFNVPFGRYENPTIVPKRRIICISKFLKGIEIRAEDFDYVLDIAEEKDMCYLDPPYYPTSRTANFTDYSANKFGLSDQKRLRDLCLELDKRGVFLIITNSDTYEVRQLYEGFDFKIHTLRTKRMISRKVTSRNLGYDLIITNKYKNNYIKL